MDMNEFRFPHSTVKKFTTKQDSAILVVSDVRYNDSLVEIKITVDGYTLLQENKGKKYENVSKLEMQAQTGEVLNINTNEDGFEVLIQWDSFQPVKIFTSSYNVCGKSIAVEVGEPYPDER